MAWLTTSADLKTDALQLAGEPFDGSSVYDARVYGYLTLVQDTLISGGSLGTIPVRAADWWWARAYPRGVVQLLKPFNDDPAPISATFTQGSRTVTLGAPLSALSNLQNYRVRLTSNTQTAQPYVLHASGSTLELRTAWIDDTVTTTAWVAYKAEYDLPVNFARFASLLYLGCFPYEFDVVDPRQLELIFPFGQIGQAAPQLAALVTERRIRFSHLPDQNYTVEFEYIEQPDPLEAGTTPTVPRQHRRVLSYGAAYLLLSDKEDSGMARLASMFSDAYRAMADEQRTTLQRASGRYGRVFPRAGRAQDQLRTVSGTPIY